MDTLLPHLIIIMTTSHTTFLYFFSFRSTTFKLICGLSPCYTWLSAALDASPSRAAWRPPAWHPSKGKSGSCVSFTASTQSLCLLALLHCAVWRKDSDAQWDPKVPNKAEAVPFPVQIHFIFSKSICSLRTVLGTLDQNLQIIPLDKHRNTKCWILQTEQSELSFPSNVLDWGVMSRLLKGALSVPENDMFHFASNQGKQPHGLSPVYLFFQEK